MRERLQGVRAKRRSHCLNLVADEQHIMFRAEFPNSCEVARGRNDNPVHVIRKVLPRKVESGLTQPRPGWARPRTQQHACH